ncbi:MAG TPA: M20/M25/M40 family metallo-hydrolase [Steroidobacteraceae bacterium]|nr:M20/M25/M40 family metallo-hydrolase [Steroidobacteraceae bacterium]
MSRFLCSALLAVLAASACDAQSPGAPLSPQELKARALFERLIAFKTSVGLGQVPAMAKYLADEFRAAGFPEADIHIFPLGETSSMVVRYRGDGSGGKPILLMAHMDVVTAKREEWQRDPFALVEENGFFFGRGTFDIKGGVACEVATFLRLKAEGFVPTRDLILMLTGDEETTEDTTADLVKNHRALIDADFALNADAGNATLDESSGVPLFFSLGTAEKSYASFELTVSNPGGHSSLPRADNAIYELADALKKVQAYRFPIMSNDTTLGYFRGIGKLTPGALGQAMQQFGANPHDQKAAALLAESPTYVGMTRTTCVPTLLRGGHAENALPESATATVNCRIFPGIDPLAVKATLQGIVGSKVAVATVGTPFWSNASPLREDVLAGVNKALHVRYPGVPIVPMQEPGLSDAVFTRGIGIATYGVGSGFIKDSDNYMHGLNERVPVQSFYDYLNFWYVLVKDLAGAPSH